MITYSYVLKGALLNGCPKTTALDLKRRIFNAISFRGFTHSSYNVIGVEFGLARMDFSAEETNEGQTVVRIQSWNINQGPKFKFSQQFFLSGTKFALIPWMQDDDEGMHELIRTIETIREYSYNDVIFGVIVISENPEEPKDIDLLAYEATNRLKVNHVFTSSLAEFMHVLVLSSIKQEKILVIWHMEGLPKQELTRPDNIRDPFQNNIVMVSDALLGILESQGFIIDEHKQITIPVTDKRFLFKMDLNALKLLVASRSCLSCSEYPCDDAYSRICIVLEDTTKRGYASNDTGLTDTDLFVLSIIYSIMEAPGNLPSSITKQFPKKRYCFKKRK